MRIIIVWVKAWSSKCLVAAVGVASREYLEKLKTRRITTQRPKKNTEFEREANPQRHVCVCLKRHTQRGSD